MAKVSLRTLAVAGCLLMVALLAYVQFFRDARPPLPLFLLFTGVWLFGAAMLLWRPAFGAWGTALYGVVLGVQLLLMHGGNAMNWVLAVGSFAVAGLALGYLVARRRGAAA